MAFSGRWSRPGPLRREAVPQWFVAEVIRELNTNLTLVKDGMAYPLPPQPEIISNETST